MSAKKPGIGRGSVVRTCPVCGVVFRAAPSNLRRFCSMACRVPAITRPIEERFWERVEKTDGCWNWTRGLGMGYGSLPKGPHGAGNIGAHVFSWQFHFGEIADGLCVLHTCDNRRCVRPDHLFLGTIADNIADMVSKGRHARGERNAGAKLTAGQVRAIRAIRDSTDTAIAHDYGMSRQQVRDIRNGIAWGHLL